MKLLSLLTFITSVAAFLAASLDELPPQPIISNVTSSGNGCPAGTTSTSLGPINTTTGACSLYNAMDKMTPLGGPGTTLSDRVKKCTISFDIAVPVGWKLRVGNKGTDFVGYLRMTKIDATSVVVNYTISEENPTVRILQPLESDS
jgi:hypothetical protein